MTSGYALDDFKDLAGQNMMLVDTGQTLTLVEVIPYTAPHWPASLPQPFRLALRSAARIVEGTYLVEFGGLRRPLFISAKPPIPGMAEFPYEACFN